MAESLRAELMSIEGIATAELEGSEEAPLGVRVQLAVGADAESVGREVERILADHGMRSHRPESSEPSNALAKSSAAENGSASGPTGGPPPPPGAEANGATADVVPMRGAAARAAGSWPMSEPGPIPEKSLDSVSVEEGREGIAVRVVVGDSAVTRQVGTGPDSLDAAIVAALAEALGVEAEVVAVQRVDAGESKLVTVLLEVAGHGQQVGSAVVGAGAAYAVALAAWRALRAPE
ncbi:MAG: hypothetical protein GY720_10510 [bacterium]|nr:hypothetical protein [bacterium]